jgi:phosphoribosylglycinamide formyltransferase-1
MSKFRMVVLISGGGTTLRNLLERKAAKLLEGDIVHVISSRADVGGLLYAKEYSVESTVIHPFDYNGLDEFSSAVFARCRSVQADLVVMGGFLKRALIPVDFEYRVVNVHPSLIPSFCGHKMYGLRVHQAVLDFGCKISGCTVHFVDNEYDHGPIIAQQSVPVLADDTAEILARRVFEAECQLYPQVLNAIAKGDVAVQDRRVQVTFR